MKQLVACLVFLAGLNNVEGQDSTGWELSFDSAKSEILIRITLPKEHYVYLKTDRATGVAGPQLTCMQTGIILSGSPVTDGNISKIKDPLFDDRYLEVCHGPVIQLRQPVRIDAGKLPSFILMTLKMYIGAPGSFQPFEQSRELHLSRHPAKPATLAIPGLDRHHPLHNCGQAVTGRTNKSLWQIFLLGLAGGFIALMTPCVFPMIPVTVSFFTGKSKNRHAGILNGGLYGAFIFLIYLACSIPFHLIAGIRPEIFNSISTNIWLNLLFFVVFTAFALSFFGLFHIVIPSSIAGNVGRKSSLGSIGGIFFMALTLTAVSFSCTGPILGTLLAGTASLGAWPLTAGMAGFGLALGFPFGLFAIFPNWLKRLPTSGGWLDTVKKTLAFAELALALKFLSNADLVSHWGILKREVFIAWWILIAIALAAYLLKPLLTRRLQDKPLTVRNICGLAVLTFAACLLPGLGPDGANRLRWLSGFPPPPSYSLYRVPAAKDRPGPDVINDYEKALELSRASGKPILIDFTGWACVNCRKMEENVWTDPEVGDFIKKNYILLSLYVDDRKELPADDQQTIRDETGKPVVLQTQGDKWARFEIINFGIASQPLYVILGKGRQLINQPVGYTPDVSAYLDWLKCGAAEQ